MNMRSCRILAAALAAVAFAACTPKASVNCTVAQAPESDFIVRKLNVNWFETVDTVKSDAAGKFSCKLEIEEGEPQFIYLYRGDTRIASLLLSAGDRVTVVADTLGKYTVEGSEESLKLQEVEATSARFAARMNALEDPAEMSRAYVEYYRERVKYVISNMKSLTIVPVLFEQLDAQRPVFFQYTDAIHFRAASDSLSSVYPKSAYVKALAKEASRREQLLELNYKISNAPRMNYPEITMPDIKGVKRSLSEVDAKVVLVHFWAPSEAAHKMLNLDALMPVYNEFKDRGFEIYSIAIEPDKATWAGIVNAQKLPWINVNDGFGTACPALRSYNVSELPASFLVTEKGIDTAVIDGAAGLRAQLSKLLK